MSGVGPGGLTLTHVCLPCKRKFISAEALSKHESQSEGHGRSLEKREEKMKKRKKEVIMAVRSLRQQIYEAEEALQSTNVVNEMVANQKSMLELQLQQLLGEYGQAQEIIEMSQHRKQCKEAGVDVPIMTREMRVGKLTLTAGASSWQSNKDVQEDKYMLGFEVKAPDGRAIAGFAVLDGHSGVLCVEHVVDAFPVHLQKALDGKAKLTDETLTQAVTEACSLTDNEFLTQARETDAGDGSTLILALVYPADTASGCKLLVACIGDSRAVLCKAYSDASSGSPQVVAVPMSEDHKPNRPDEQRRVESKGGIVDFEGVWRVFMPGPAKFNGQLLSRWGLAVSRSFGDLLLKEPEKYDCAGVAPGGLVIATPEIRISNLEPTQDRFLILGSDGIWDVVSNEDAVALVAAQPTTELAARRLLRHTYACNSDDNITALVLTWKMLG
eukprot:TRINITY_DN91706_c0_g1_i1.p1 TRINITY_DN91706_c0_g1~~TRINITY_DN91706_c0_g1_i1.p1  ORF type:complete len:442 (-),score=113.50 TRINITY_DN91706_c0_g1_i1:113-1438(-)